MTTLRDMPMISVEQKNAFREAALEVEKQRDEAKRMLASACEYLSRVSVLVGAQDNEDPQTIVEMVEGVVLERDKLRNEREAWSAMAVALADSLTYALSEGEADQIAQKIAGLVHDEGGALARRDALMKAEALEDKAAEMIAMNDERNMFSVHWAAKDLQRVAAEYRKQAEGEA
tara:strand:+ start:1153 stop:1674 length:522 start_codon:yes stop_codon:yes gene_type:complete